MSTAATPKIGHYFEFKRGTHAVDAEGKVTHYQGSGLSYVGTLTEAAKKRKGDDGHYSQETD